MWPNCRCMNATKLLHRVDKNPKHSMLVLNSSSAIMFTGNKWSMIQYDNVTNDQLEIHVLNKSSNSIQTAMFYTKDCCKVIFLSGHKNRHAVDGTNPANQSRLVVLSQYLHGFMHARWLAGFLNHQKSGPKIDISKCFHHLTPRSTKQGGSLMFAKSQ